VVDGIIKLFRDNRIKTKLTDRTARALKDQSGMTMVEVLMGFVILSLMLGSLSGIISFSSKMYENSVDIKRCEEKLQAIIYKSNVSADAKKVSDSFNLVDKEGTKIGIDAEYYALDTEDVFDEGEKSTLDVTIFYFKAKEETTE